jgi:hypothetical protein
MESQHMEEPWLDDSAIDALRRRGQVKVPWAQEQGDVRERSAALPPVDAIRYRDLAAPGQDHQAVGASIWERVKQNTTNDAKSRYAGANT